jgi:hypothetical protein
MDEYKIHVLQVGNTAHVPEVLAAYMDEYYGTRSVLLERGTESPAKFVLKVLWKARSFDVVHVHYGDVLLPWLRRCYPSKILVIHYHGDDIRNKWKQKQKRWKHANLILYEGLDIKTDDMPTSAVELPNPVDEELFQRYPSPTPPYKSALTFSHFADDLAKGLAKQHGLELTIMERSVPYVKMPFVLRNYEYYVDVKRNFEGIRLGKGDNISVTALQALACGLKVVKWDGQIMEEFPEEHLLKNSCKKLFDLYLRSVRAQTAGIHERKEGIGTSSTDEEVWNGEPILIPQAEACCATFL